MNTIDDFVTLKIRVAAPNLPEGNRVAVIMGDRVLCASSDAATVRLVSGLIAQHPDLDTAALAI